MWGDLGTVHGMVTKDEDGTVFAWVTDDDHDIEGVGRKFDSWQGAIETLLYNGWPYDRTKVWTA